jgi:hypothetical protein
MGFSYDQSKHWENNMSNKYFSFFIALIYGLALVGFNNYQFDSFVFQDRSMYLNYYSYAQVLLPTYFEAGITPLLINEPIWLLLNLGLVQLFSPMATFNLIVFSGSFLFAYNFINLSRIKQSNISGIFIVLLFLLMPLTLKNYTTHIRQGFAIGILLAGLGTSGIKQKVLMVISIFIHTSMMAVLFFWLIHQSRRFNRLGLDLKIIIIIIFSLLLAFGLEWVAQILGDRRLYSYSFERPPVSGLGGLFWFTILLVGITNGKSWLKDNSYFLYAIIFYLITYFFIEVSARFFESSIPIILMIGLTMHYLRRRLFLGLIAFHASLSWILQFIGYRSSF